MFLSSILIWEPGPIEQMLKPDGTAGQEIAQLPLEGLRLMGGGGVTLIQDGGAGDGDHSAGNRELRDVDHRAGGTVGAAKRGAMSVADPDELAFVGERGQEHVGRDDIVGAIAGFGQVHCIARGISF